MYSSSDSTTNTSDTPDNNSNTTLWVAFAGAVAGQALGQIAIGAFAWLRKITAPKVTQTLESWAKIFSKRELTDIEQYLSEDLTKEQANILSDLVESLKKDRQLSKQIFSKDLGFAGQYSSAYTMLVKNITEYEINLASTQIAPSVYTSVLKKLDFTMDINFSNIVKEFIKDQISTARCIYTQSNHEDDHDHSTTWHRFIFGHYNSESVFTGAAAIVVVQPSGSSMDEEQRSSTALLKMDLEMLLTIGTPSRDTPCLSSTLTPTLSRADVSELDLNGSANPSASSSGSSQKDSKKKKQIGSSLDEDSLRNILIEPSFPKTPQVDEKKQKQLAKLSIPGSPNVTRHLLSPSSSPEVSPNFSKARENRPQESSHCSSQESPNILSVSSPSLPTSSLRVYEVNKNGI